MSISIALFHSKIKLQRHKRNRIIKILCDIVLKYHKLHNNDKVIILNSFCNWNRLFEYDSSANSSNYNLIISTLNSNIEFYFKHGILKYNLNSYISFPFKNLLFQNE